MTQTSEETLIRPQLWIPKDLYDLWKSTVYKVNGVDRGVLTKTLEETFWFWINDKENKSNDKSRKVGLEGIQEQGKQNGRSK